MVSRGQSTVTEKIGFCVHLYGVDVIDRGIWGKYGREFVIDEKVEKQLF